MDKCCGDCKHWHPKKIQQYTLRIGKCDKIKKGTKEFDGITFEDECYDDDLHCFEEGR